MTRRLGLVANVLAVVCMVIALVTRGDGIEGVYFNRGVDEPSWIFDPQHVAAWLIAAIVLVIVGSVLLLLRREPSHGPPVGLAATVLAVACIVVALVTHHQVEHASLNRSSGSDPAVAGVVSASVPNTTPWVLIAIVLVVVGSVSATTASVSKEADRWKWPA